VEHIDLKFVKVHKESRTWSAANRGERTGRCTQVGSRSVPAQGGMSEHGKESERTGTPCPESASELCRPSDRRLSAKLLPTFSDRGCLVVSVTDPYGRPLGFRDRSRYCFFRVDPHLFSRG
jgi:hypothetical protein